MRLANSCLQVTIHFHLGQGEQHVQFQNIVSNNTFVTYLTIYENHVPGIPRTPELRHHKHMGV